jgi:hypothetical protein
MLTNGRIAMEFSGAGQDAERVLKTCVGKSGAVESDRPTLPEFCGITNVR